MQSASSLLSGAGHDIFPIDLAGYTASVHTATSDISTAVISVDDGTEESCRWMSDDNGSDVGGSSMVNSAGGVDDTGGGYRRQCVVRTRSKRGHRRRRRDTKTLSMESWDSGIIVYKVVGWGCGTRYSVVRRAVFLSGQAGPPLAAAFE